MSREIASERPTDVFTLETPCIFACGNGTEKAPLHLGQLKVAPAVEGGAFNARLQYGHENANGCCAASRTGGGGVIVGGGFFPVKMLE